MCLYVLKIVCVCVDYGTRMSYFGMPFRAVSFCSLRTKISKTRKLLLNGIQFVYNLVAKVLNDGLIKNI